MKINKVLLVILLALAIIIATVNIVYADSVSVNLKSDKSSYTAGETVNITVSLSNIDSSAGIYGLQGVLNYDTEVFEPIVSDENANTESITSLVNSGTVSYGASENVFNFVTTTPIKTSQNIMEIRLKVKSDAKLGSTFIILGESGSLKASNAQSDISTSPATLSITINETSIIPAASPSPAVEEPSPVIEQPSAEPTSISTMPSPASYAPIIPSTNPSSGKLPQTGINDYPILIVIGGMMIVTGITFIAYRKYRNY